jgi:tetrathionate reductase subunit A
LMNVVDAQRLGLQDGDSVKVVSASNPGGTWNLMDGTEKPMTGKLKVIQGMRPGVVSFALGYGHWASGARDITINGTTIAGDPRRATGVHANAAMRVDPHLKNVTLQDLAGGSAVFYDTKVNVIKA